MPAKINYYLRAILVTLFLANTAALLVVLVSHFTGMGTVTKDGQSIQSWQLFFIKLAAYIVLIGVNLSAAAWLLRLETDDTT